MIWTILWVGWILAFFAIEIPAIRNDLREDTLSEHIRRWFSTKTHHGRSVFIVAWLAFTVWFVPHIVWGIW